MPGQWWILRRCSTTNTRTRDEMRRRSCGTPVARVLTVKPAIVTVRLTALTTVLYPHQAKKNIMRWVTETHVSRTKPLHRSTVVPALCPTRAIFFSILIYFRILIHHNYKACITLVVFQLATCLPHRQASENYQNIIKTHITSETISLKARQMIHIYHNNLCPIMIFNMFFFFFMHEKYCAACSPFKGPLKDAAHVHRSCSSRVLPLHFPVQRQ